MQLAETVNPHKMPRMAVRAMAVETAVAAAAGGSPAALQTASAAPDPARFGEAPWVGDGVGVADADGDTATIIPSFDPPAGWPWATMTSRPWAKMTGGSWLKMTIEPSLRVASAFWFPLEDGWSSLEEGGAGTGSGVTALAGGRASADDSLAPVDAVSATDPGDIPAVRSPGVPALGDIAGLAAGLEPALPSVPAMAAAVQAEAALSAPGNPSRSADGVVNLASRGWFAGSADGAVFIERRGDPASRVTIAEGMVLGPLGRVERIRGGTRGPIVVRTRYGGDILEARHP